MPSPARHDGWQPNPVDFKLGDLPPLLDYLRSQPEYAGKQDRFDIFWLSGLSNPPTLDFASSSPAQRAEFAEAVFSGVEQLIPHGITRMPVPVAATASAGEFQDYLRWFAEDVAPHT